MPGQGSANPAGKPKGVRALILSKCSAAELVEAHVSIMRGEPQLVPQQVKGPDGKYLLLEGVPAALIPELDERAKSRAWLCDHVFGKAPDRVEVAAVETPALDPATLPDDDLASLARLTAAVVARQSAERRADAEGRGSGDPAQELQ